MASRFSEVLKTTSPIDAISILQAREVEVVICDQMMPAMKGVDLLALIRKRWPRVVTILLTACGDLNLVEQALNQGLIDYFVTKPWNTTRFLEIISEAVVKYNKRGERNNAVTDVSPTSNGIRQHARSAAFALSRAVDARDRYTCKHSENVAAYAVAVAKRMGCREDLCELVRIGGLLHDLGKIGIPDGILLKKGRLEDSEFKAIKMHPTIGSAIIDPIGFPDEVTAIVRQHHENYNGSGYPHGLKENEIDFTARIVRVADAYDAMTTDRVYRKSCSKEYIIGELEKFKGIQFDPEVTEVFLGALQSGTLHPEGSTVCFE